MAGATVSRDELVAYLDGYLEAGRGRDHCPNGLQVEGRHEIGRIVSGVSACRELFRAARQREADAVLVHHGLFWSGGDPRLVGVQHGRVAELIHGELNLLAYHLPLDRHPELGNNALACRALELSGLEPFGELDGELWGFRGRFAEPRPFPSVLRSCRELYGQEPLALGDGPERVQSVGVVSGGAQKLLAQAIAAGLDVFVTGEVSEWVTNLAREAGIHYLAVGHYASETLGVRALGEHVARRFGVEVEFVDVPNPV